MCLDQDICNQVSLFRQLFLVICTAPFPFPLYIIAGSLMRQPARNKVKLRPSSLNLVSLLKKLMNIQKLLKLSTHLSTIPGIQDNYLFLLSRKYSNRYQPQGKILETISRDGRVCLESKMSQDPANQSYRLTAAEQREFQSRMERKQMKEFMGVSLHIQFKS